MTMANGWTDERRAKQAQRIHDWKPWEKSTGAKTPEGKAKSSKNAFRFTFRKCRIVAYWLYRQKRKLERGEVYASIPEVEAMLRWAHCEENVGGTSEATQLL